MNRWDIINHFIKKYRYISYLEIGYYKGWSFDHIECEEKTAVDPNPSRTHWQEEAPKDVAVFHDNTPYMIWKMSSDDFFQYEAGNYKWDIIFIDGLHEAGQVYKDIQNSLKHLTDDGVIILHDCNPPKYEHTTTGIDGCWTGDTYKAILEIQSKGYTKFVYYTIDIDWGCGILKPFAEIKAEDGLISTTAVIMDLRDLDWQKAKTDWSYFDQNRKELLNLISVEEFLKRES